MRIQIHTNKQTKFRVVLRMVLRGFAIIVLFLAVPLFVRGATLYLEPAVGIHNIGTNFSVNVMVNSRGEPINAAEASLIFNPAELRVISISKAGSIFTLWTTEPVFCNTAGTIEFGGGTPTPFIGTTGRIKTIVFRGRKSAVAEVNFVSGAVLAADGRGTNVLANMHNGRYTIKPAVIVPLPEEIPHVIGTPDAPVVSSITHPDSEKWYSNNAPKFTWEKPADITAVKLLINRIPRAIPIVVHIPPISERQLEDLADGVWYFHTRFRNVVGWGKVSHRRVLIDTEAPKPFEVIVDNENDATNPTPILRFETTDVTSGIDFYEIRINGEIIATTEEKFYRMPVQRPGEYTITVKAFDKAGNSTVALADIVIEPIEKPIIVDYPVEARVGDVLAIKGTSIFPESLVTIFVQREGEEPRINNAKTDKQGNWSYIHPEKLEKGIYQVWALITDARGAKSEPTEKITIPVTLPPFLVIGRLAIDYLIIIITLILMIIGAAAIIFYTRYRISIWRKKIKKETEEASESVDTTFKTLKKEVEKQIEFLDGKPGLNEDEREIQDKLKKALNASKKSISKEIKDVEKEIE